MGCNLQLDRAAIFKCIDLDTCSRETIEPAHLCTWKQTSDQNEAVIEAT